jgi:hypothetical protein
MNQEDRSLYSIPSAIKKKKKSGDIGELPAKEKKDQQIVQKIKP